MTARFAGSQRVGDRRRRRLAVEADGEVDSLAGTVSLPAAGGKIRVVDRPHQPAEPQSAAPTAFLPVTSVVPTERWKYATAAACVFFVNALLVAAGAQLTSLAAWGGEGLGAIFAPIHGSATKWFSGLLLGLSAQCAALVWWARSRSRKDFEGRYWLWIRATAVWIAFSVGISLELAKVAEQTMKHLRPNSSSLVVSLVWLIPTALVGLTLARNLYREMFGCRASRLMFAGALASYFFAVGFDIELINAIGLKPNSTLAHAGLLMGHTALAFSMWVHARHVIHCTSEPAQIPKRSWQIPRPHFLAKLRFPKLRFPQIKFRSGKSTAETTSEDETATPDRKKRTKKRKPTAKRRVDQPEELIPEESDVAQTSEIDDRDSLEPEVEAQTSEPEADWDEPVEPAPQKAPAREQLRGNVQPAELDEFSSNQGENDEPSYESNEATAENDGADGEFADDPDAPDLRGLSKKQRRRAMAEYRERQRRRE